MGIKSNLSDHYKKDAIYKIVVKGKVDDSWSDSFRGMQITVKMSGRNIVTSTLIGEIADQTALTSILNSLYDMHFTVISVNMLSEIENNKNP